MNPNDRAIVLCRNQRIAEIDESSNAANCLAISESSIDDAADQDELPRTVQQLEDFFNEYKFNIGPDLEPDVRLELLQLLYKRR